MKSDIENALREASEVWLTTFDAVGNPGSVPIWFLYADDKVYVATGRGSKKVLKLQATPKVGIRVRGSKLTLEATGRIVSDRQMVERVAPILNQKYGGAWGDDTRMIGRLMAEDIVLLEITLA